MVTEIEFATQLGEQLPTIDRAARGRKNKPPEEPTLVPPYFGLGDIDLRRATLIGRVG
jgi:hypothetical protein